MRKKFSNPIAWGVLITLIFALLLIWLGASPYYENAVDGTIQSRSKFKKFLSSSPNEIGDALAGIAGSLAFLWIIVTVALQSQQLDEQRKELEFTRDEIKKGNDAFNKQMFENSFFSMLKTYNSIVESVDIDVTNQSLLDMIERKQAPKNIQSGKDAFAELLKRLMWQFDFLKNDGDTNESEEEVIFEAYAEFWESYQNELGHYFRFLYRFFLILEESELAETKHSKILRGFLSDQELVLIFYNCLYPRGEKFKRLAIEFSIFDNLPVKMLANPSHKKLIHPKAFDSNYSIGRSNP